MLKNNKVEIQVMDVIGIGIGAFNLSLAALLQKTKMKYKFFEQRKSFSWHNGMLLENAKLQVHFLKDLACCVDPSNPYTFLSYLSDHGLMYQFLNRKKSTVSRNEFDKYFKWAAARIPELNFDEKVVDLKYENKRFEVTTMRGKFYSNNIVIGTGITPYISGRFVEFIGENFLHNYQFRQFSEATDFSNKRIAIIGGGQSGAEVFDTLISLKKKPLEIIWASKLLNFQAMENSCFANEFYTPSYVKYFYELPKNIRELKLNKQRLTSDGITQEFSDEIYDKLYELKYVHTENINFTLIPNHTLMNVKKINNGYIISFLDHDCNQRIDHAVDVVILATGYKSNIPDYIKNLIPEIKNTDALPVNLNYSINWKYNDTNKIYIQNGAKHTHGIADPNLSLAAWRNATIINSLNGDLVYKIDKDRQMIEKSIIVNRDDSIFQLERAV